MESQSLVLFFITAVFLVGAAVVFSSLVPRKSYNPQKFEPYECGIPTIGGAWLQYTVGYYLFAILFLIFDVETVFVYPWAVIMHQAGLVGFIEILIFFFILGLGLLYAWKKHALKWE
ncbi:MAG: NADH-quinone oxidoreductase subunit A [Bacteroidetes bacterium]|nr:NADH-quinone oxidoreductase subunit A [Bacteroidota bacterium]